MKRLLPVFLLFVVVLSACSPGGQQTSQTEQDDYKIDRPEFQNEPDSVGDPLALMEEKNTSAPVKVAGKDIIQACQVVSIEDIRQAGLHIYPNPLSGAVTRHYFDGEGKGSMPEPDKYSLPMDTNQCMYTLYPGKGGLTINVYQPSYSSAIAIDDKLRRKYSPSQKIAGIDTYNLNAEEDDEAGFFLRKGDIGVELTFALSSAKIDQSKQQQLLQKAANNLAKMINQPTGPKKYTFSSPIFKNKGVRSCDLIDNQSVQQVFQKHASPIVEEQMGTAIGIIQFLTAKDPNNYNYVETSCFRPTEDADLGRKKGVKVDTTTYEQEQAAKRDTNFNKNGSKGRTVSVNGVDEAFYGNLAGMDHAITLRKGRVVVHVTLFDENELSDEEYISRLLPVANQIASKLPQDAI